MNFSKMNSSRQWYERKNIELEIFPHKYSNRLSMMESFLTLPSRYSELWHGGCSFFYKNFSPSIIMNFCLYYFLSLAYVEFLTRPKRDPKSFLMCLLTSLLEGSQWLTNLPYNQLPTRSLSNQCWREKSFCRAIWASFISLPRNFFCSNQMVDV